MEQNKASDAESASRNNPVLKEILAISLAPPAAFGILSQIDKRLELNETLEKIVLNYDLIIQEVRSFILSQTGIDIDNFALFIFCCFMAMQILIEASMRKEKPDFAWGALSFLTLYFSAFYVFPLKPDLDSGWQIASPIVVGMLLSSGLFVGLTIELSEFRRRRLVKTGKVSMQGIEEDTEKSPALLYVRIFYLLCALGLTHELLELFWFENTRIVGIENWSLAIGSILYFSVVGAALYFRSKGPAYAMCWVLGMLAFNWLANSGLPSLNGWLDSIGAV